MTRVGQTQAQALKKRNLHTECVSPHPTSEAGKKKKKKKKTVKDKRDEVGTPFVSSPTIVKSLISKQEKKGGKKKSPCHPLTCPSGKIGKVHLCKQKQLGAAKMPNLSTGHAGIWDEPKDQRAAQRKGKMHLQGRVQASAEEGVCNKKRFYLHRGM